MSWMDRFLHELARPEEVAEFVRVALCVVALFVIVFWL